MLDFTDDQKKALLIWANEKLMDILDGADYDGDDWFTVDDTIPELSGKVDVNIYDWEDENGNAIIKACAYAVVELPNGTVTTVCDSWLDLF